MSEKSITIHLPESLYAALEEVAEASGWTVEAAVIQSIRTGMPPALERVPVKFHEDLLALNKLDDQALWKFIEDKQLEETEDIKKADFSRLRRAYAYHLLKWRGHPLPDPVEVLL